MLNRRDMLRTGGAALAALGAFPFGEFARADASKKKKLLVFTRSQTFEHSVVRPAKGKTKSLVEEVATALGDKNNFEVMHTKDGRIFEPDTIKQFDAFLF